jgi:type IV pilus assembly protein PilV
MQLMHARQAGFTLTEVLVALLIFAFGMLGVAGLQMKAMVGMDSAQFRSVASLKAGELAERIRANPGATYSGVAGADNNCRTAHYADRHATPDDCTPAKLAADDIDDWSDELAGRLPGGTGTVCIDSTPDDGSAAAPACDGSGSVLAIKVWWNERPRGANSSTARRLTVSMVNP